MSFRESLSKFWNNVQCTLFPMLENDLGELSFDHKNLAGILELIRIEDFIPCSKFNDGRPPKDRCQIARAYIAKIVFKFKYTKQLIGALKSDKQLKLICGWDAISKIPNQSKFSRVFNEFSKSGLPEKVHQYLIKQVYKDEIIGHIIKDSSPLVVREKALKKESKEQRKKENNEKKKRQRKGELNRRQKQLRETNVDKIIEELPNACDKGMKKSAQGYTTIWKGYKLHAAVDDHCVPLAVIITSASTNDCEAAIPLAMKAHKLVTNFYDLMDAAYDHPEIREHSISLNHIPIIDQCPFSKKQKKAKEAEKNRKQLLNFSTSEDRRYKERFPKERFNAIYKDYCGGHNIFYRGHSKVNCHVMFGILTLAASTIINLI